MEIVSCHKQIQCIHIKDWGIGLSYTKPNDWFARFDYARRIGSDDKMSEDARSRQRMWFIAGKVF
ncbi:MAG: hypothetical protein IJ601_12655 [Acidaminococcaceae bacterium]|nr:hypothetical protein [Acidaminococcaceae bacterium]